MTINIEKLERFIQLIKENSIKLKEIIKKGKKEFINDYRNYNTALRLLQISIEAMIDIGNHIIARKSLGNPKDYVDIFLILQKNNIIKKSDFEKFSKMVKFRNRIVHIYWDIELNQVYDIIKDNLSDFLIFINKIKKIIEINHVN